MNVLINDIEDLITKFRDLCEDEKSFVDGIDTESQMQEYFKEMKRLLTFTDEYKELPADLVFALSTWGHKVMYKYLDQLTPEDQTILIVKELIGDEHNWDNLVELLEGTPLQVEFGAPINDSYEVQNREKDTNKEGTNIAKRGTQRRRTEAETVLANDLESDSVLDTNKELSNMHRQLIEIFKKNGNEPISYYRIIIDPEDFYITCHNAFVLTLLLQLHEVEFLNDENNETVVRMITAKRKPEFARIKNKMAVASFSPLSWKEKIKKLNITKSLLNSENRKKEHLEAYSQTEASEEEFVAIFGQEWH